MRYELVDYEWTAIKPILPNKLRGVPWVNDRYILNGIFWVLGSLAPWRDLFEAFGPYPAMPLIKRHIADAILVVQIARRKPTACSFKTLMICSSVNLLLRIICPLAENRNPNLNSRTFQGCRSHDSSHTY